MQHKKHLKTKKKETRRIQSLKATHRSGISRCQIDFFSFSLPLSIVLHFN